MPLIAPEPLDVAVLVRGKVVFRDDLDAAFKVIAQRTGIADPNVRYWEHFDNEASRGRLGDPADVEFTDVARFIFPDDGELRIEYRRKRRLLNVITSDLSLRPNTITRGWTKRTPSLLDRLKFLIGPNHWHPQPVILRPETKKEYYRKRRNRLRRSVTALPGWIQTASKTATAVIVLAGIIAAAARWVF